MNNSVLVISVYTGKYLQYLIDWDLIFRLFWKKSPHCVMMIQSQLVNCFHQLAVGTKKM